MGSFDQARLWRRTKARTRQFLDSLGDIEKEIEEDIAESPEHERDEVRKIGQETRALVKHLREELKLSFIGEARSKRQR